MIRKEILDILKENNDGELVVSNCHMCDSAYCGANEKALEEIYQLGISVGKDEH